jgi:putative SOS response-associated peptidase YedK
MCGRYYADDDTAREIEKIVRNIDNRLNAETKYGEIYPTNNVMVLKNEDSNPILCNMIWGFPQYQRKGVIFNARSETAMEKRTFASSVKERRCIIPAKGFYEWDKDKNRVAFERPNSDVMLLAGIWNTYGLDSRVTILTTEANESMQNIHDRMPLIMEQRELETWLYDDNSVEFLLHKKPGGLSIASGGVQQTLDLF